MSQEVTTRELRAVARDVGDALHLLRKVAAYDGVPEARTLLSSVLDRLDDVLDEQPVPRPGDRVRHRRPPPTGELVETTVTRVQHDHPLYGSVVWGELAGEATARFRPAEPAGDEEHG